MVPGCIACANAHSTLASIRSVLAKIPAARELPDAVGWDQTHSNLRTNQRSLVTTARFTDHLDRSLHLIDPPDELPMTCRLVRESAFLPPNCRVQIILGNVDSKIDKLLFHVINNSCF